VIWKVQISFIVPESFLFNKELQEEKDKFKRANYEIQQNQQGNADFNNIADWKKLCR
jgi:hypothetical protein